MSSLLKLTRGKFLHLLLNLNVGHHLLWLHCLHHVLILLPDFSNLLTMWGLQLGWFTVLHPRNVFSLLAAEALKKNRHWIQLSSVQPLSCVRLFVTPWAAARQASLSLTNSTCLLKLIHVHQVGDAIQPSHPLSSPSPPTFNLSQHQGLFKWVSSSHQVAKVLEFQLQHQSFKWIFRRDFL